MKFYTLDTEFTFGKYEGKTVKEILELGKSNSSKTIMTTMMITIDENLTDNMKAHTPKTLKV